MFTDAKFLSAKEKEQVFRAWCRFLKNRFKRTCFTGALYHHLMQHCGFIAHYDIHGFYGTYFTDPNDTKSFISAFKRQLWFNPDYQDINGAMLKELAKIEATLIDELDRAELEKLKGERTAIQQRIVALEKKSCGDRLEG